MTVRIALLHEHPDLAGTLLEVDAFGRIIDRDRIDPQRPATAQPGARTVLVVPGQAVGAHWLDLPAHSPQQALAAAWRLLQDRSAGDPRQLHVAVAPFAGDAPRLVATVDPEAMREWLRHATALGLTTIDALLPDHLALPPGADGNARVATVGDDWIVRADDLAFRAEAELARLVLGDRAREPVANAAALESLLAAGAANSSINLLQYDFAPASERADVRRYRRAVRLAAVLLLSPLLLWGVDALRHRIAAGELETAADARARALLPGLPASAPAVATLVSRAAELRAGDDAARAAATLFAALRPLEGAQLDALSWGPDGRLAVTLSHRAAADLDALRATLTAAGFTLEIGGTRQAEGHLASEMLIAVDGVQTEAGR